MSRNKPKEICCPKMVQAMQPGTDNEMYGKAIYYFDGSFKLGCNLDDLVYCPWCGLELSKCNQEETK
jgi:hypothetical protein